MEESEATHGCFVPVRCVAVGTSLATLFVVVVYYSTRRLIYLFNDEHNVLLFVFRWNTVLDCWKGKRDTVHATLKGSR
jgi:hypothetical protein